jgi:alpha-glucuronidase
MRNGNFPRTVEENSWYQRRNMIRTLLLSFCLAVVAAENGLDAWLRYAPLPSAPRNLPSTIVTLNSTVGGPVQVAGVELQRGLNGIFKKKVGVTASAQNFASSVIVGTVGEFVKAYGDIEIPAMGEDGFWLSTKGNTIKIVGQNERGALYGTFEYLSMLAQGNFSDVNYATTPNAPIRCKSTPRE